MKCQEARRHWDMFYDSEGDAELHHQLNRHLEGCAACAQWFDQQSRLESLIETQLKSDVSFGSSYARDTTEVDWSKILIGAGVNPAPQTRRRSIFRASIFGSALLALAASMLLIVGFPSWNRQDDDSPNLTQLSSEVHHHVSTGGLRPDYESDSDIDIDQYLLKRVAFPVRCPPRKDSGFVVSGAGLCEFENQPAAYVVGSVDQRPVSIFVLPRESLVAFPRQQAELGRSLVGAKRTANCEMVYSIIDKNVVLVMGDVDLEKLTRVLKSYGTYPHAS